MSDGLLIRRAFLHQRGFSRLSFWQELGSRELKVIRGGREGDARCSVLLTKVADRTPGVPLVPERGRCPASWCGMAEYSQG